MNLLAHLTAQKLIHPPGWLPDNVHYLTIMGSVAYGVADTKLTAAHSNLGAVLKDKGNLAGAMASYREAIRLDPKDADARRGLALAERRLVLWERYPAIKRGTDLPKSSAEAVEFAEIAIFQVERQHALAYRLYLTAFAGDAKLIEPNRNNAACCAVRFAAGDDPHEKPFDKQRLSLRRQAAEWLALDLSSVRKLLASEKTEDRQEAVRLIHHWLEDTDLASVRDPKRLEALSPDERQRWEAFWADVRAELAKATAPGKP